MIRVAFIFEPHPEKNCRGAFKNFQKKYREKEYLSKPPPLELKEDDCYFPLQIIATAQSL
jgi:hypothetical protein